MREPRFDFGGAAPQEFVTVAGLSMQVMASNLNALHCSVAESVIMSGTVDDSADILARCASTSRWPSCINVWLGSRDGDGAEL